MPTPWKKDEEMGEPIQRFSVSVPRELIQRVNALLRREDSINRSAFIRRAMLREIDAIERERRRRPTE